jgi:hypothetical protein
MFEFLTALVDPIPPINIGTPKEREPESFPAKGFNRF